MRSPHLWRGTFAEQTHEAHERFHIRNKTVSALELRSRQKESLPVTPKLNDFDFDPTTAGLRFRKYFSHDRRH